MKRSWTYPLFLLIKWMVWLFYPKMKVEGTENLPDEACIIVANHSQMNGPIACELYSPVSRYTWCAGEMMHLKEVPAYAFQDFWSMKPKTVRWFYRALSYVIAPLSVLIFNNARTIPVYKDARIIQTFRQTLLKLDQGESIVIFPENDPPKNNILSSFQEGFVDAARMYYKKTGRRIAFVPMYIAPKLKKMVLGKPTYFMDENPISLERSRISNSMFEKITILAESLPKHTVITYRSIPGKPYPFNK